MSRLWISSPTNMPRNMLCPAQFRFGISIQQCMSETGPPGQDLSAVAAVHIPSLPATAAPVRDRVDTLLAVPIPRVKRGDSKPAAVLGVAHMVVALTAWAGVAAAAASVLSAAVPKARIFWSGGVTAPLLVIPAVAADRLGVPDSACRLLLAARTRTGVCSTCILAAGLFCCGCGRCSWCVCCCCCRCCMPVAVVDDGTADN